MSIYTSDDLEESLDSSKYMFWLYIGEQNKERVALLERNFALQQSISNVWFLHDPHSHRL